MPGIVPRPRSGPDEAVATELERSADRARARGGLAAAAAFLERSANLSVDPGRRVERMLAAAQFHLQAGSFDAALGLLAAAEAVATDQFAHARIDLIRGQIASASSAGSRAPVQLLQAATRLEPLDVALARETYLDAWGAALQAGHLAGAGGSLLEVSQAARAARRPPDAPGPWDLLLDALAAVITEGRAAATPLLAHALRAVRDEDGADGRFQQFQWVALVSSAAVGIWDFETWDALSTRQLEHARSAGALTLLSMALNGKALIATWRGDFETAESLSAEDDALKQATGIRISPYGAMLLAAYQGRKADASMLFAATTKDAGERGEGLGITIAAWATALLNNGLGRYEDALAAAEQASEATPGLSISDWALVELIEAATRCRKISRASEALERLVKSTDVGESDWAVGLAARSRALLSEGEAAERLYLEGIDRLGRTRLRPELARARLLYGEWLRRENRRADAREQLRTAYDVFAAMGADGFADRARHELLATGEKVRKRRDDTRVDLTPQEEHIARLARDGRTNPEIGAELFISARTVEWHLRKVFTKLGITSRKDLHDAMPSRDRSTAPA